MLLSEIRTKINKAEGARRQLTEQLAKADTDLDRLTDFKESLDKATALLQTVAKETQQQLQFHIEDVVQLAMDTVFPDTYEFRVEFEAKRGRTEARIFLLENGNEIDPMESSGGGLVDIVAFALRFAAWGLSKTARIITFDEPFKFLDKTRKPLAMEILKQLSTRLGLQIIAVTHDQEVVDIADKIIQVELVQDGKWRVSIINHIDLR